ncbi:uncharacterized protein LOC136750727 [Amia ocellicauda]|uniref:uncharacterized protein LOC136750727 n=1 Tax=Amia ocellicauda TaxID=2972642 RepID=UPI0034640A8C
MTALCVSALLLCTLYVRGAAVVSQPHLSVSARLGDPVTLIPADKRVQWHWFKKSKDQPPVCIASASSHFSQSTTFGELKNNTRIEVKKNSGSSELRFPSAERSDAAKYYCAAYYLSYMSFGNGTHLLLNGSESKNASQDSEERTHPSSCHYIILSLVVANTVFVISNVVFICLWKNSRRLARGLHQMAVNPPKDQNPSTDMLNYAALNFTHSQVQPGRKRREVDRQIVSGDSSGTEPPGHRHTLL